MLILGVITTIFFVKQKSYDKHLQETAIVECPHCSRIVKELTENHICKDCQNYFMGMEITKQQQQLTFFKTEYNDKGEKIK